jgi:GntR family transcriptional regulator, transcriptional repressor for pyruvate dehydrogenase complex
VTQQTVKTQRIHAEIKKLADGRLNPGDRLRSEPEVSEGFQGNRALVRETIRDLEALGLPTSKNGAGPHVPTGAVDLLSPLVSSILQPKDVRLDLFETHEIIESEIATLAAKGAKSEGIPRGERIPEDHARRIAQGDAGVEAGTAFHARLTRATKNAVLLQLNDAPMESLRETRERSLQIHGRSARCLGGNPHILKAIRTRSSAKQAMLQHLVSGLRQEETRTLSFYLNKSSSCTPKTKKRIR